MLPGERDRAECHHCGRMISRDRRKNLGKGFTKHRCPHGRWCDTGDKFRCGNNRAGCEHCRKSAPYQIKVCGH